MTTLEQIRALAAQGIGRKATEATIGRAMSDDELDAWRKADTVRRLKIAAKKAKGPASGADRVAKHVSERNEVGEIPPPRHPRLKERCRYDLELFGWMYFRPFLKHRASADIRDALVRDAQNCALSGGMTAELIARGGGKTTWIDIILPAWAVLYGHRSFPVTFGASMRAAKKNLKSVKRHFARSPEILADFPAIAIPIRQLGGISQRCASQTYHGQPTDIEWGSDQITLPMVRDDSGQPLDAGCGAILAATGIGGAIRGANEGGKRPDMVLIDDPQTKKAAASPKLVQSILEYIHSDALALAGHDTTIAAFLTITPQRYGDVATEISSQAKYPEWAVKVQPFIKTLPPKWDQLVTLFCEQYALDAAAKDYDRPRSTAWYRENAALFESMETIDPEQYDKTREIDVNHHLLNLRAKLGKVAFNAEIMMQVSDAASEIQITADTVANALNGAPRGVCPPGTDTVVGCCDINIQAGAGLSWALVAFGPSRVGAVIDYGRFPADGSPLVPPNSSDLLRNRRVAAAIREVVNIVATRRIRDAKNRAVRVRALGFDRGWLPDVVHRTLYVIRKRVPVGFPIVAMRGFPWNKFGTRASDILRRGDHIFATRSKYGEYLAFMAPYWREIQQSGWLETPLMPGSLSTFGQDALTHTQLATEVCAEKLVRKYQAYSGRETTTAWDWITTGPEHYCDALTGAFALASWFRAYDALSQTIDAAALGVKPIEGHQDDLFDPMRNSALLAAYDGASDTTEGTGDAGTLPHPSEQDLEAALEDGRERPDYPTPKFKTVDSLTQSVISRRAAERQRALRKLAKFKKGKWRK
ncbi:MAG: hypothetical protein J6V72_05300 [Kiritimatiellae bacterium]|nr:hypothetical protein [Kiritimatiellia bacterium]